MRIPSRTDKKTMQRKRMRGRSLSTGTPPLRPFASIEKERTRTCCLRSPSMMATLFSSSTSLRIIIGTLFIFVSLVLVSRHSSSFLRTWKSNNTTRNQTRITQTPLCLYPIVALITLDPAHCQGASVLYGSILRTVIAEKLTHRSVCLNFMYVNASISVQTMLRWEEQDSPSANLIECHGLMNEQMKKIVPISWYPIPKLIPPRWSTPMLQRWAISMSQIHIWAFDRFERIFILDVDVVVLRELTKIVDETPLIYDIAAGINGWLGCYDRSQLNGGVLLIKGSRYLHTVALQLLEDPKASCESHRWVLAHQELLNCLCGFSEIRSQRPEFKCLLLPIYNHVFTRSYNCTDIRVRPLRLIHFAGDKKPWQVQTNQTTERDQLFWWCLRDAMSKTIDDLMRCEPFSL